MKGQPRPPPRKGQRRAWRGITRQPQCRCSRGPWRQARRLRRQPATPEQTGPWARRSKGHPPPSRGPAKPGGPGPAKRPPRAGQRSPEHPPPERETTNAPAAGGILHTKMDTVPTITLPICTLYSWIQAPLPPEGQSAPDPGAEPPSLWRGDRKTTPVPRSSREDHQPRPRPDGQLVLTAPSPGQRTGILTDGNNVPTSYRRVKGPHTRAEPKRMHQPTLPAEHQPGPKPPRPSRNPSPVAEWPQNPKPPPDLPRSSTAARLATYVRRHRPPQKRRMQQPEKQHPRATNTPSRPGPQPQR
ncbi:hypothetical protein M9458_051457 [Cirrhinus mrigala]|uniref:Uncharacterized protein n=1 Tax=Cirrhinus mrigala TaxID=683832 RepID=A0ABD0MVZ1_CIRMR